MRMHYTGEGLGTRVLEKFEVIMGGFPVQAFPKTLKKLFLIKVRPDLTNS